MVLAPNGVEEILRLTIQAWRLAERYRNPVVLLLDETLGRMTEPVTLPETHAVVSEAPPVGAVEGRPARGSTRPRFGHRADTEKSPCL